MLTLIRQPVILWPQVLLLANSLGTNAWAGDHLEVQFGLTGAFPNGWLPPICGSVRRVLMVGSREQQQQQSY